MEHQNSFKKLWNVDSSDFLHEAPKRRRLLTAPPKHNNLFNVEKWFTILQTSLIKRIIWHTDLSLLFLRTIIRIWQLLFVFLKQFYCPVLFFDVKEILMLPRFCALVTCFFSSRVMGMAAWRHWIKIVTSLLQNVKCLIKFNT